MTVRAFVGPNGGGKTLAAMTLVVLPALRSGRRVVSTCVIDHPLASVLQSPAQIVELRECVLFLDEITTSLSSRLSMQTPAELVRTLNQPRKAEVEVCWTAPNWARADVVLREVTQLVTVCRGWLPDRFERLPEVPPWYRLNPPVARDLDGHPVRRVRVWPANRLFRWVTYDVVQFDEFTYHSVRDVRPLKRNFYWRPWHADQYSYDTNQAVQMLSQVDDSGVCLRCGGVRRRPVCTCREGGGRAGDAVGARPPALRGADRP